MHHLQVNSVETPQKHSTMLASGASAKRLKHWQLEAAFEDRLVEPPRGDDDDGEMENSELFIENQRIANREQLEPHSAIPAWRLQLR